MPTCHTRSLGNLRPYQFNNNTILSGTEQIFPHIIKFLLSLQC